MIVTRTIAETRAAVAAARGEGMSIGFVPTMGYLHAGHRALIERARRESGFVAVSIFVNPAQFGLNEDFASYPRDFDRDAQLCAEAGVDLIFVPSPEEMYPEGFQTHVEVEGLSQGLCGASRPGHFRGVATVVAKLLIIAQPDRAYFGEKDAQQLRVIKRMIHDLNLPVTIVPVPTVREPDGLALSSRNVYLSPEERQAALVLSRALSLGRELVNGGERDTFAVERQMRALIEAEPLARLDYLALVDDETLEPVETIKRPILAALAVYFGKTRLIDNALLEPLPSHSPADRLRL